MSTTYIVALLGSGCYVVGVLVGLYIGFERGREWVWRRERDYWKENQ